MENSSNVTRVLWRDFIRCRLVSFMDDFHNPPKFAPY